MDLGLKTNKQTQEKSPATFLHYTLVDSRVTLSQTNALSSRLLAL